MRKVVEKYSIQPVVWCVKKFSDKFQTFLKAGRLTVFSFLNTFPHFTHQMRRFQILSGSIVVAYLLVFFHTDPEKKVKFKPRSKRSSALISYSPYMNDLKPALRYVWNAHIKASSADRRAGLI